jgi:hypothetical protein
MKNLMPPPIYREGWVLPVVAGALVSLMTGKS